MARTEKVGLGISWVPPGHITQMCQSERYRKGPNLASTRAVPFLNGSAPQGALKGLNVIGSLLAGIDAADAPGGEKSDGSDADGGADGNAAQAWLGHDDTIAWAVSPRSH